MLKKSALYFNPSVFPKRVIDLRATIGKEGGVCFCIPTDWSFHVVSHTWSQDIRALSQRVAAALLIERGWRKEDDEGGVRYNLAFEEARFSGEPCYKALLEFFSVLVADGVRNVWFDALCINQLNDEEKESEICSMGAYYRLSAGCYVATHGIGTECGFQALDSEGRLPRWFTRAWTLQEALLPEELHFIVEKFDRQILQSLAQSWEEDREWIDWDKETEEFSRRKIPYEREQGKELYCLDVKAYKVMMSTLIDVRDRFLRDIQDRGMRLDFNHAYARLHKKPDEFYVEEVVKHIRRRECSVEEDRVLSILGLLGFQGHYQVRTKLTLDEQIVRLAKMLMNEKPTLLVNLCAADLEGYGGSPHISWLPDLRHRKFSRFEVDINAAHESEVVTRHSAKVVMVKDNGSLVMRASTTHASLTRHGSTHVQQSRDTPYHLDIGQTFTIQLSQSPTYNSLPYTHQWNHPEDAPFVAQDPHSLLSVQPDGPFHFDWCGGMSIPAHGIHHLKEYQNPTSLRICDIMLILLGHCGLSSTPLPSHVCSWLVLVI